jgi:hypothetical protein
VLGLNRERIERIYRANEGAVIAGSVGKRRSA